METKSNMSPQSHHALLATIKMGLRLEGRGMKISRGRPSARSVAKREGYTGTIPEMIAAIERDMATLVAQSKG
jgi:hypothetical protein